MNHPDPLEAGLERLDIPDIWEMAAIIKAQQRRRPPKPSNSEPKAPDGLRTIPPEQML